MAGPQSISEEELLYFKGLRILHKAIAPELRQLFKKLWEQLEGSPWQDDRTSGESFFDKYKPRSIDKRYDDMIKTGKVEAWDMTVLCRAFIEYSLMNAIDSTYSESVSILRKLRNQYAHNVDLVRHRGDYDNDMRQVKKVFTDMGLNENNLTHIEPDDMERQELLNEMNTLRQELEKRINELSNTLSEDDRKILIELQTMTEDLTEAKEELNKLTSVGRELINELRTLMKEGPIRLTGSYHEATGGEDRPDMKDLPDWFRRVPHGHQQLVVTDKLIGRIAQHIGAEWEVIATEMGIDKPKREAIIVKHPTIQLRVSEAMSVWKQKTSRQATITSLMKILWACNNRCTINWEGIEAEVMK
ncbi:uncharacterized protein [Haliotis asinina]|uniref:uncharacterized protein isoform X2 n=1 Tax=Haliotis asinina TaxID=109174 RepID=UPI0035324D3D